MRCGVCKATDVDIDHVKGCYAGKYRSSDKFNGPSGLEKVADDAQGWESGRDVFTADSLIDEMTQSRKEQDGPMWPASDKQINYALGLQDERILPDNWEIYDEAMLRSKERDEVSGIITMLTAFPRGDKPRKQWTMPPGRYALIVNIHHAEKDEHGRTVNADISTGWTESQWWFFQIDKPTEGRWKGYTFIKRLIGAPGDYRKVDLPPRDRDQFLQRIEGDPKEAMVNYGRQTSVCGRCHSPLTDEASRARGIGPVCAQKDGWF